MITYQCSWPDVVWLYHFHPSAPKSDFPHLFMINYAIGGISGWPIDLERYGNGSDMYVDYVRVYAAEDINKK